MENLRNKETFPPYITCIVRDRSKSSETQLFATELHCFLQNKRSCVRMRTRARMRGQRNVQKPFFFHMNLTKVLPGQALKHRIINSYFRKTDTKYLLYDTRLCVRGKTRKHNLMCVNVNMTYKLIL